MLTFRIRFGTENPWGIRNRAPVRAVELGGPLSRSRLWALARGYALLHGAPGPRPEAVHAFASEAAAWDPAATVLQWDPDDPPDAPEGAFAVACHDLLGWLPADLYRISEDGRVEEGLVLLSAPTSVADPPGPADLPRLQLDFTWRPAADPQYRDPRLRGLLERWAGERRGETVLLPVGALAFLDRVQAMGAGLVLADERAADDSDPGLEPALDVEGLAQLVPLLWIRDGDRVRVVVRF